MAATVQLLLSIDNAGYFEADVSNENPFRDVLTSKPYEIDAEGFVVPTTRIEVDEAFLLAHPFIPGKQFV